MSKTMLKNKIRNLEEKALPTPHFEPVDFFNFGWEDVPRGQGLTGPEKEAIVRERMKNYVKKNWSQMEPAMKNCYMAKFASLELRLTGNLVEEAKPT